MSVPTVQGIEVIDFHLHFRIEHDPATRDLSGGQFACSDHDEEAQRRRAELVAAQSAKWRRAWDFPDPQPSDERTWQEEADLWLDELDRYVDLQLLGHDADVAIPGMREHLEGCPACREEHESLAALALGPT